jgi:hypothetical protein
MGSSRYRGRYWSLGNSAEWKLFVLISDEQGTKSPSISGHSFSVGFCRGLKAGMAELIHSEI